MSQLQKRPKRKSSSNISKTEEQSELKRLVWLHSKLPFRTGCYVKNAKIMEAKNEYELM